MSHFRQHSRTQTQFVFTSTDVVNAQAPLASPDKFEPHLDSRSTIIAKSVVSMFCHICAILNFECFHILIKVLVTQNGVYRRDRRIAKNIFRLGFLHLCFEDTRDANLQQIKRSVLPNPFGAA